MFRFTRRKLLLSYFGLIIVWIIIIISMHIVIGGWSPVWLLFGPSRKLDHNQLRWLMSSSYVDENNATLFFNPLSQLLAPDNNLLHFFSLPKRKSHLIYGEVMSKNCYYCYYLLLIYC